MKYSTPYLREIQEQGIRLPAVLCQKRTDEGREKRRGGIEVFRYKFLTPRTDGICNTLTSIKKDNLIMTTNNKPDMEYHPNPTKEDLLEYFGQRIRIRKMVPDEAGKLMGLNENDLEKINAYPFSSYQERDAFLAKADENEKKRVKRESISKTAKYRLYGNSIVIQVLTNIFRTMFIPGQPENKVSKPTQMSIFDYL